MSLAIDIGKVVPATGTPSRPAFRRIRLGGLVPYLVPVALILAWQLASSLGLIGNRLMPATTQQIPTATS